MTTDEAIDDELAVNSRSFSAAASCGGAAAGGAPSAAGRVGRVGGR